MTIPLTNGQSVKRGLWGSSPQDLPPPLSLSYLLSGVTLTATSQVIKTSPWPKVIKVVVKPKNPEEQSANSVQRKKRGGDAGDGHLG
jgi:hypothetical protein